MGLSNDAKQTVTTHQILIELVQGLKSIGDADAFDQIVKDAYALPEAEQAKADEARSKIKLYQDLIVEQKKRADDIEAAQDNLDLRTKQINDALAAIDSKNADISSSNRKLDALGKDLALREAALVDGQAKLMAAQNKLDADRVQLEKDRAEFEADKAELKAKSDQVKALTEGL